MDYLQCWLLSWRQNVSKKYVHAVFYALSNGMPRTFVHLFHDIICNVDFSVDDEMFLKTKTYSFLCSIEWNVQNLCTIFSRWKKFTSKFYFWECFGPYLWNWYCCSYSQSCELLSAVQKLSATGQYHKTLGVHVV